MVRRIPSALLGPVLRQSVAHLSETYVAGKTWVYLLHWQDRGPCKIGMADDPRQRLVELQVGNPYDLFLFEAWGFPERIHAQQIEAAILKRLKSCRLRGEWVNATPLQVATAMTALLKEMGHDPRMWEAAPKSYKGRKKAYARAAAAMDEYRALNSI